MIPASTMVSGLSPRQNSEVPPLDYERVYRLKLDFPGLEIVLNGGGICRRMPTSRGRPKW